MATKRKPKTGKDPLMAAAVIKVSWQLRGKQAEIFEEVYAGVLRDHGITDEQVERYLDKHRGKVEAMVRGEGS